MILAAWLVPVLAGVTGWLVWSRLATGPDERDDALERIFAATVTGVFVTGLAALLLAEFGRLRPWTLSLALAVLAVVFGRLPRRCGPASTARRSHVAAVLLVLLAGAATLWPASEDLIGGRDAGTYANTARWLAQTGSLRIYSEPITTVADEAHSVFFGSVLGPGFYLGRPVRGELFPQFLHLLPVYMAIGHWLGALPGAFLVPPFLGVLAELALFMFVRRMLGLGTALVAAGVLALNLAQMWGMRNPYSEGVTQLGVFAALWCIARASDTGGLRWGIVGGLALGVCFLARIDMGLLLMAIGPAVVLLCASGPGDHRWASRALFPVAVSLAAWSLVHGWLFSPLYLRDLSRRVVPLWTVAGLVAALSFVGLRWRASLRSALAWVFERDRYVWTLMAVALCTAFVVGMWIRPYWEPFAIRARTGSRTFNEETLVRMAWYVSVPGMIGGFGGLLLLLRRLLVRRQTDWIPFLSIFLAFSLLYFWRSQIAPDHPWAMRRYLPVILPGICLTFSAAVSWLWSSRHPWRHAGRLAALVMTVTVIAHEVTMASPYWTFREKQGVPEQLDEIARQIPDNSILLSDYPRGAHPVAIPLAISFGRPVLTVIRSPRTDPEGEQRRSRFEAQVMRWLREGREVLYLTSDGPHPTFLAHTLRWDAVSRVAVEYPTMGESFRNPPRSVQTRRFRYRLLRAVPALTPLTACTERLWTANEPLLFREQGFYTSEGKNDARFRWAMPRARIVFPACDRSGSGRPSALRIRAACGRDPSKADCRLQLKVNGHPTDTVELSRRASDHVVAVPPEAIVDPVGAIEIRFIGPDPPSRRSSSRRDRRMLSFQLSNVIVE